MGISKFDTLDYLLGNVQRPFKYSVEIKLPPDLVKIVGTLFNQVLDAVCKEISTPQMELSTVEIGIDGRMVSLPTYTKVNNQTSINIYLDEKHTVKHAMEFWLASFDPSVFSNLEAPAFAGSSASGLLGRLANTAVNGITNTLGNKLGGVVKNALGLTGSTSGEITDLTGEIVLRCLNYNGIEVCSYTFKNVVPLSVGPAVFSDENIGDVSTATITFNYTHCEREGTKDILDSVTRLIGL